MSENKSSNKSKKELDKKENKDDKIINEDIVQKRKLTDAEKVHSANDWEHVDLGDDSRRSKFLRLMGATKKDHHGKIIIGDKQPVHIRTKEETEKVSEVLEEQFNHGIEMKVSGNVRRHVGLGFQKDGSQSPPGSTSPKSKHDTWNSSDEENYNKKDAKSLNKESSSSSDKATKNEKTFGLFVKASD